MSWYQEDFKYTWRLNIETYQLLSNKYFLIIQKKGTNNTKIKKENLLNVIFSSRILFRISAEVSATLGKSP